MDQFFDESDGFFFFNNPKSETLIANKKEIFDNVIPASNSIMARNLHRLGLLTYEEKYSQLAKSMLGGMAELVAKEPGFLANWGHLYLENLVPTAEIAIVGKGAESLALQFLQKGISNIVLAWSETPTETAPILQGKTPDPTGNALIYVCFDRACRRPVSTLDEALAQLPYLD